MKELLFIPKPERVDYSGQSFPAPDRWTVCLPQALQEMATGLRRLWTELAIASDGQETEGAGRISFYHEEGLPEEGYRLEITGERTVIGYGTVKGAYYAMVTLHQAVFQSDGMIPCCRIVDGPALSLRGVLVDISRGKVPRLETLKRLADLLASLKYNHLELYIEGFSYGYRSHPQVWREDACLLAEEVRELADYCRECFIELVPQQNSLGHMAGWLTLPEYRGLAETEEGLAVMGRTFPPTTLNASDPGSLGLVKCLFEDLKVSFEPGLFHVGLDEAFEFGKGKNKALLEQGGGEGLLVSYIEALHKMLGDEGFRMMMWDDLMSKYPQMVGKVPEDILIVNWGYDREYPVERKARYLQEAGRRFCLSPGTSSWSSFAGLTDNMLENIRRTAAAAHKYGAEGMLVTDWGDMNHLQYQPVSYPGFAYGAALAWNREGMKEEELADALNGFVFADTSGRMGQIALQAGRFYLEEEFRLPCRSLACLPLMFGRISRREYEEKVRWLAESVTFFSPPEVCSAYLESYETRKPFQAKRLYGFLEARLAELDKVRLEGTEGALIVREYRNALKILLYLTQVREEILEGVGSGGYDRLYPEIVEEHESLWTARNKRSGLEDGVRMFERIC